MTDSTLLTHHCRHSNVGYIWLAYSAFFFLEPVFRKDIRFWAICLGIYAVFLALYVTYVRTESSVVRLWCLAGFSVLGLAAYPIVPGSSGFVVFTAAFAPFVLRRSGHVVTLMAVLTALILAEGLHHDPRNLTYASTIFFILVVGTSNLFMAQQKRSDSRLRLANDEIGKLGALAERERIARDLHDVLGHTLSVIVLKAELARRLLEREPDQPAPQRAIEEIADVESTARTALAEVREAIGGYRSKGLAAELELARRTLDCAGVRLTVDARHAPLATALRPTDETVLALAIREAVTNIVRHAHATEAHIVLSATASGACALRVRDNGPHRIAQEGNGQEGNGLRGMRERVEVLQGRFSIASSLDPAEPGTLLEIEVPLARPEPGLASALHAQPMAAAAFAASDSAADPGHPVDHARQPVSTHA